ncbi:MAG: hypothetical protein DRN81_03575 [Thermoproteota archaeon]|nr:MAG: hypothetical protein DRN81_03575 [Candidatus Korarchaeota archaeon]
MINPRTTPEKTLKAAILCATELGLLEKDEKESRLRLSALGLDLAEITTKEEVGKPEMSRQVKAFFHALAQKYPEVRVALQILKAHKGKMRLLQDICPMCKKNFYAEVRKGKISCPNCGYEIDPKSSDCLHTKLIAKLLPIPTFWINSEVLPVKTEFRNRYIKYYQK